MTVLQAMRLNIYTLKHFEATKRLSISLLYAPQTGIRTPPRATRTETISAAPESRWTATTVGSNPVADFSD
jgi:hypothetical protein